jgi:hypothetical protein
MDELFLPGTVHNSLWVAKIAVGLFEDLDLCRQLGAIARRNYRRKWNVRLHSDKYPLEPEIHSVVTVLLYHCNDVFDKMPEAAVVAPVVVAPGVPASSRQNPSAPSPGDSGSGHSSFPSNPAQGPWSPSTTWVPPPPSPDEFRFPSSPSRSPSSPPPPPPVLDVFCYSHWKLQIAEIDTTCTKRAESAAAALAAGWYCSKKHRFWYCFSCSDKFPRLR